ncbi:MAG: cupin domain-containing protein [Terriglobales bacterium]
MLRLVWLFPLLPLLAAQPIKEVEITSEPAHHLALENSYVRVFKVEVAPHAATLLHRHRHDYVFVSLGPSHISNEVEGKPPVEVNLSDGEARFTDGNFAHIARNLSDQPFRNVAIELLQDEKLRQTRSRWPMEGGDKIFPGGHSKVIFVRDGVRVSEAELDAGTIVPSHRHEGPHLLVAVSDLNLRSDVEGKGPELWKLHSGDVMWLPAGYAHSLTNTGAQAARFVTVEF